MRGIPLVIWESLALASLAVFAWLFNEYVPQGRPKTLIVAGIAICLLWPVRYRWESTHGRTTKCPETANSNAKSQEKATDCAETLPGRYIRIPYLFVGFCELAIIFFDRYKGNGADANPK